MPISTSISDQFEYPAHMVKRYINNLELFTLLLTDGEIVQYIAPDATVFKNWLRSHNIPDIRQIELSTKTP